MPTPASIPCALCLRIAPLQASHIIPEFCYRPLYDAQHRAHIIRGNAADPAPPFTQQGTRYPLLCRDCEQHLNRNFEAKVARYWNRNTTPIPTPVPGGTFTIQVPNYADFKLFHMSILWRAGMAQRRAAEQTEYVNVYLTDSHAERLRNCLLNCDPGGADSYPIMATAIVDPLHPGELVDELIVPPMATNLFGMHAYMFVFGGCQWVYFCSGHFDYRLNPYRLKTDGSMPMIRTPFTELEDVMRITGEHARRQGLP